MTKIPNKTTYAIAYWRGVIACYLGRSDFSIMYVDDYVGFEVDGEERSVRADRLEWASVEVKNEKD